MSDSLIDLVENKTTLMPEFRFSEFVNEKTWLIKTLGELTYVISKRNKENKSLPVYSINNKEGFLPQGEQFEGISSTDRNYDISLYKIIDRNTFAYNPARINIGSIGYSGDLHDIIISSLYVCFKTTDKISDEFLLQIFKTTHFIKEVENNVEGGIRNYLFYQNFSNIKIPIPSLSEQQKIAGCLSSLDELITANKEKLEALKAHKKGLMQNLFPQEGQTLPNYRFPEFEDVGEWEERSIGSLTTVSSGGTPTSTEPKYWGGNIPWMNSGELNLKRVYSVENNITELGLKESSTKMIPPLCVLIGLAGQGKTRGTAAINYIELCTNQSIAAIHPNKKKFNSEFLYYKIDLMYETLRGLSTGEGGRGGLNLSIIRAIKIQIPSINEQQKIASCLSGLDELIITQTEKIEQLQQHKKGLLVGLFPKI